MGLSGRQRKELQSALVDAFPTKSSLEQMLSFELDKNLEVIAPSGSLQEIIFRTIQTAESEGWIKDLVRAARKTNSGNLKLQAIKLTSGSELSSRNHVQQALLKQVRTEVKSRLNQSLHNRIYIVQDTQQNPSQIELPWSSEIKVGSKPKVRLTNTEITAVYDQSDIAGRLLILGEPGIGKTTMLLKLAEQLVNRAKNDPVHPIPVLFSLSSWKNDNQNIKDWLIDQLKDKYGVRKDIGKGLVDNQEIISLLDGLDELAAERQEKCVVKINEFLHPSSWSNSVVVCSRIEEYQRYQTLLQLNNSLELCPFTPEQVYQYLQSTDNLQLWDSISQDADLNQLTRTPLLLNIIVLSAQEISLQTWQQFQSSEERQSYLFDGYIRRMLKRKYEGRQPKQENTKRWLGWLAQRLIDDSVTEFLIERIQPTLLKNKIQKLVYNLIVWGVIGMLIFGLLMGIFVGVVSVFSPLKELKTLIYRQIVGLIFGLFFGLISGLISGLIYGLVGEFIEKKIEKTVILINPLKNLNKIIIKWLVYGLIYGLIFGLITGLIYGLIYGLIFGLIAGLFFGLFFELIGDKIQAIETLKFYLNKFFIGLILWLIIGVILWLITGVINGLIFGVITGLIYGLIYGLNGLEIENKNTPNQGIRQSLINTIILLFATSLPFSLLSFISIKIARNEMNFNELLIGSFMFGLFFGMLVGITRSGTPAIKHFVLRVILSFNGYAPWNYAKFLDYCTERLFLQRVGGGYRFIHDLLRQHFANSYAQIQKRS
ncbi:NACHT domain-containing protein [Scytonema sp. UIC 10036]|uniref:effector-associated domain EAD1-containing protein n=1 Tax=Scytonema sp. UIC 10036 TaxID=2304196 RepID=UPI0012DAB231|nr:effector-associated domain EAD1-containing protein [Scytonema sp. UIC 10036]MUG99774.1 NACHT domain-containing protein [Scytonema sp. UIC 10036]